MWVLLIDELLGNGLDSRAHIIQEFDKQCRWGTPQNPDAASWGETDDAKREAQTMLAMAQGGIPRDRPAAPKAKRPKAPTPAEK